MLTLGEHAETLPTHPSVHMFFSFSIDVLLFLQTTLSGQTFVTLSFQLV